MIATPDLRRLVALARAATSGGWCWSVTPASCRPSAGAGCSPSCAATAGSTSSNTSTASPTPGRPTRRCCCAPATRERWTPTRRTGGSSPAPWTSISTGSPTPGSTVTTRGDTVAVVASTNDHVDLLNAAVQDRPARSSATSTPTPPSAIAGGERRPRRGRGGHPTQRPPARHHRRGAGAQPGTVDRHRHPRDGSLTVSHNDGHGQVDAARRLRPRACAARVRGDRARLPVRHRHHRHRPRQRGDHPPRPVRRRRPAAARRTGSSSSPTATTWPRPATSSNASSPSTAPTSPPSPNAANSPNKTATHVHRNRSSRPHRVGARSQNGSRRCLLTPAAISMG